MGEPVQRQLPKFQDAGCCPLWDRPCVHSSPLAPHGLARVLPTFPQEEGSCLSERGISSRLARGLRAPLREQALPSPFQ